MRLELRIIGADPEGSSTKSLADWIRTMTFESLHTHPRDIGTVSAPEDGHSEYGLVDAQHTKLAQRSRSREIMPSL